jgi:hypothetical protein
MWLWVTLYCPVVQGGVSARTARSIFVQVNLDDELYEQSDSDVRFLLQRLGECTCCVR